ncbi:kelch repeat-containing protein At1g19470-like [Eutrema salsugineum]|uniref:kelch repeat-containing protein At1g19470-like n=1 Tax=Eutrema salsugineum TaxID=72664 RepID=UPI000CECE8DC|nr:kelch repeat-containing protein At1g19470-like [Eutrema salsugineum]
MAVTSETPDGSNGGDPNKKSEDVEKEGKEEDENQKKYSIVRFLSQIFHTNSPNKEIEEENQKEKPVDQEEEIQYRSISFPNLPHEVTERCVALFRRCNYPSLSLISKGFRTLTASPRLYDARSRPGVTKSVLYAAFGFLPSPGPSWYILRRNEISSRLFRIDELPSMLWGSAVVAIGSKMYVIGGSAGGKPSSDVTLIDCRSHTYRLLPRMRRPRCRAAAGVIDGKIYVVGGCARRSSTTWVESFDVNF